MSSILTSAQLTTLKNAINSDPNLAAPLAAGDLGAITAYYNANGASNLWRPDIEVSELNNGIVWADFIGLTIAKQNGYFAMTQGGFVNATASNIRSGFSSVFGAGSASLTNLTAIAQRVGTRLELLFATAAGAASVTATNVYGYTLTTADVVLALNS